MKFGIIGGSGLYDIEGIEDISKETVTTPFGEPSDEFTTGILEGTEVVFLPRHGKGHRILPNELNHKANIYAMKKLGVTHIISISAVGSLKEELKPRDVVMVDQYFDRTKRGSEQTFFGNGIVGHIAFADPVCMELKNCVYEAACVAASESTEDGSDVKIHDGGTYINMEGPAFSTRAESNVYRSWGMDVIGMTNMAEAKLAREAGICYCTVAMVTDFDCWHPDHDHVTLEMIIGNLMANSTLAKNIIRKSLVAKDKLSEECSCRHTLDNAVVTNPDLIPEEIKQQLSIIL